MSSTTDDSSFTNVTSDGLLRKSIQTEGTGEDAGRGAKVTVKYSLFLREGYVDGQLIESSESRPNGTLTFTQGRRKVIAALDALAQSMKLGEKCRAVADAPYAFGPEGLKRKNVPAHAAILLHVEMVSFEGGEKTKALADMTAHERLQQALVCKEQGNSLFKELKYEKAMIQYSQCIRYVTNVFYKPTVRAASPLSISSDKKPTVEASIKQTQLTEEESAETSVVETQSTEEQTAEGQTDHESAEPPVKETQQTEDESEQTLVQETELTEDESANSNDADAEKDGFSEAIVLEEEAEEEEEVIETLDVSTASVGDESFQKSQSSAGYSQLNGHSRKATEGATSPENMDTTDTENGRDEEEKDPTSDPAGPSKDEVKDEEAADANDEKEDDRPDIKEVRSLHVAALNNLSLCLVKMEQFKQAVDSATLALEIEPISSKAFYYR